MVQGVVSVFLIVLALIGCVAGELKVRLVEGTEWSGRLEVCSNDTCGTVCDNGFESKEAQVVCTMLGLPKQGAVTVKSDMYGEGLGDIYSINCKGTENSLEKCDLSGSPDCGHREDVGVICNSPGNITPRLVRGRSWFGLLEVLYDGVWSTVCSRGFGHKEVKAVCKMIRHPFTNSPLAVAMSFPFYFRGREEDSILFSDLDCDGTETSLAQCKHSGFYNHTCTHDDDVSVNCALDGVYRLAGPRRTRDDMGRLMILVGPLARNNDLGWEDIVLPRMWSGVCGNNYSPITTARVICKQLGYPSRNAMLVPGSSFGPMNSFWITEVNCTGDEISMIACVQLITGYSSSCPTQDIGVVCSDSNPGLYILLETFGKDDVYPPFEGSNVSLKCEGTKKIHSAAIYTWTETAGGRPSGAHLIFDSLAKENSGRRVKCEAHFYYNGSSHEKLSSEAIKLQVYYKPLIKITSDVNTCQPHATSDTCYITMGHNVTLVCSAESNPVPVSFEWFNKTMATREKLNIISANALRHEGLYNCTVQTKSDDYDKRLPLSAFYVFTIIVQEPPVVLGFTANGEDNTTIIVDENSNVSLSCEAAGRPKPHMVLRSDANSRELNRIAHDDSQSKEKTSNIYFFIHKIRCQDSGAYRCEADNSVGHENRTRFILVPCAPRLRDLQGELPPVTIINFKESFTLELIAYPPPEVKQMYYGPVNDTLGGQLKDLLDVTCGAKIFAPALFTCNITVVNKSDDGVYRIVFENDHGQLPFNFTRKILSKKLKSSGCGPVS